MIFNHLVQLHDVRVAHLLKYSYLSIDSIDIRLVFYFVLFKYLDCNFVARYAMSSLLNLSKCSFSLGLADDETANNFALAILLFFWIFWVICVLFSFSIIICRRFLGRLSWFVRSGGRIPLLFNIGLIW